MQLCVWCWNLRGGVVGAPAARFEEMAVAHDVPEAEISNLDVVIGVEEEVLRLEVAVHHQVPVAVLHT